MGAGVGKGLLGLGFSVVPGVGVTPTPSTLPGMAVGMRMGTLVVGGVRVGLLGLRVVGGVNVEPGQGVAGTGVTEGTGAQTGTRQHESLGSATSVQPAGTWS